jgi:hypothetical protein
MSGQYTYGSSALRVEEAAIQGPLHATRLSSSMARSQRTTWFQLAGIRDASSSLRSVAGVR